VQANKPTLKAYFPLHEPYVRVYRHQPKTQNVTFRVSDGNSPFPISNPPASGGRDDRQVATRQGRRPVDAGDTAICSLILTLKHLEEVHQIT